MPIRIADMSMAEMTEAMHRGWGSRDCRSPMLLELERTGVAIEVYSAAINQVLKDDPPFKS